MWKVGLNTMNQCCGSASFNANPDPDLNLNFHFDTDPGPDGHQNDADPHSVPTPSFTHVEK
jgi:hypothetical protein